MRVLIAKYEVAGYFQGLAQALSQNSFDVSTFFVRDHPFYKLENTQGILYELCRKATKLRENTSREKLISKLFVVLLDEILKLFMVLKCAKSFDVIIFSYGEDISGRFYEPLIFKFMKTKVHFFFLGSDIRPTEMSLKFQESRNLTSLRIKAKEDYRIKKVLRRIAKHQATVISYPAYSQLISSPYVDIFQFGLPVTASINSRIKRDKLRLCHIPSDTVIKKTSKIETILQTIKAEFSNEVEINIVYNIKNSDVRKLLSDSDIIITELESDTPCPLIAIEACAEGCVPIVAGDFVNKFVSYYGTDLLPPYPYVSSDHVLSTLKQLVQNRNALEKLSIDCKRYYEAHHTPMIVGKKLRRFLLEKVGSEFLRFESSS